MKFIRYSVLVLALAAVSQPLQADTRVRDVVGAAVQEANEDETFRTLLKFSAIGVVSGLVHLGAKQFEFSAATQAYAHAANVLLQLGYIADKPALTRLGVDAILAGVAQRAGTSDFMMKNLLPNVPFVGQYLAQAGVQGSAAATIAVYKLLERFHATGAKIVKGVATAEQGKSEL